MAASTAHPSSSSAGSGTTVAYELADLITVIDAAASSVG
jgi:hypothetical protein